MLKLNEKYHKKISYLLYIILIFFCIALIVNNQQVRMENNINKNNIISLHDSIESQILKNGELLQSKSSLQLEKGDLERVLNINKKEIKELERKLDSKISTIQTLESQLEIKNPIIHDSIIIINDTVISNWNFWDDWTTINANSIYINNNIKTSIDNITISIPLTVGITKDNKFFVTSPNPYIKFTDIKSVIIPESTIAKAFRRWSVGVYVGFGMQYGLLNKSIDLGPQIGIGINYRIW